MTLWGRIAAALNDRKLDEDLFETAAMFFLSAVYPGLSPIPGGGDFGRDADIHGAGDVPPRVICTSGKAVKANVTKNLRRAASTHLDVREIVVVVSVPMDGLAQRKLEVDIAAEHGIEIVGIYERGWLIGKLYADAEWRDRLIQVRGDPSALLQAPIEFSSQPGREATLVGRDTEIGAIALSTDDVILAGPPGVGKTRLLADMPDAWFLQPAGRAQVADDVRSVRPGVVVVDDAHRRLDELRLLLHIRAEDPAGFRIVVITWPDTVPAVIDVLPAAYCQTLLLLERKDIDQLLTSQGISSYYLRREVIEQAQGRPGWAIVLCGLVKDGRADHLMQGTGLIQQLDRYLRRIERPEAMDVMACVALLGGMDDEQIASLCDVVSLTEPEIHGMLLSLADNGLAERRAKVWYIEPRVVRPALVGHWFFGQQRRRALSPLLAAYPQCEASILRSVIAAGLHGSPGAIQEAKDRVPVAVEAGIVDLIPSYGLLDAEAAEWAVARLRIGSARDLPGYARDGLASALVPLAARFRLPSAVKALLDLAVGDDRPQNSTPQHASRQLQELAGKVLPDQVTLEGMRSDIIQSVCEWMTEVDLTAERSRIVGDVLSQALAPTIGGVWDDVADAMKIHVSRGIDSAQHIRRLVDGDWPRVEVLLARLPDSVIVALLQAVEEWLLIAAGKSRGMNVVVPGAARAAARDGSDRIVVSLRARCASSLGLSVRYNRLARRYRRPPLLPVPRDFAFISLDLMEWYGREEWVGGRLRRIAATWVKRGPGPVLGQLVAWRPELELVGSHHEILQRALYELGHSVPSPTEWVHQALAAGYCPEGFLFFTAAIEREPDRVMEWLPTAVAGDCAPTARAVLTLHLDGLDPEARAIALSQLEDNRITNALLSVASKPSVAIHILRDLLTHPSEEVRHRSSLERSPGPDGPPVPDVLRDAWTNALLDGASRTREYSEHEGYRLGRILPWLVEHEPGAAMQWFARRLGVVGRMTYARAIPRVGREVMRTLPRAFRTELYRSFADDPGASSLFADLLGDDIEWMEALLADGVLSVGHAGGAINRSHRGPLFERAASLLLRFGATNAQVLACLEAGWHTGDESVVYDDLRSYCEGLAGGSDGGLSDLGRAGEAYFRRLREHAEADERQQRVYGPRGARDE